MKPFLFALLMILLAAAANAEGLVAPPTDNETCGEGRPDVVDVRTRYGVVSYKGFKVNGKYVPTDRLTTQDAIWFKKLFRVGDDDVLLSTGIYMGNTSWEPNQDFLLVLGPGTAPHVVLIPGGSACPMWQQGDALYTGGGKDECGNTLPILKFEHGEFIASGVKKPDCVRPPHALEGRICRDEFETAKSLCSRIPKEKCAADANAGNAGQYGPMSEMAWLNNAVREPYFNTQGFNWFCQARCSGAKVSYSVYRESLCAAR